MLRSRRAVIFLRLLIGRGLSSTQALDFSKPGVQPDEGTHGIAKQEFIFDDFGVKDLRHSEIPLSKIALLHTVALSYHESR